MPDLKENYRVITRIYANLKGLGYVCQKKGILANSSILEDFARAFTGSKQLFDFIDVGVGKDRADDKISGEKGERIRFWEASSNSCRNIQIAFIR